MKRNCLGILTLLTAAALAANGRSAVADDIIHDTVWARPPLPVNSTGTTAYGSGTYMTETPTIKAQTGYMGGIEARGWVKFDVSTIPPGSDIVACSLLIRCLQVTTVPSPIEVRVLTMNTDLLTNINEPLAQQFFLESQTNPVACETLYPTASGWLTARFTAAGLTALEARLAQGWAALSLRGVNASSWNAWFNGRSSVNDSSLAPRLIVSYAGGGPTRDVAVTRLLAPTGSVPYDTTVTPACSVYNHGQFEPFYRVRMRIGSFYDEVVDVTNHGTGERRLVQFPTWYVLQSPGSYAVACSTRLDGDGDNSNDSLLASVTVLDSNAGKDVGVSQILVPAGEVGANTVVIPQVQVANYGTVNVSCDVRLVITDSAVPPNILYDTTETGIAVPVDSTVVRSFARRWTAGPVGPYITRAFTILPGDQNHSNDTALGGGTVLPGPAVDVGVVRINAPTGSLDTSAAVIASATFRNWGAAPASFTAFVKLTGPGGLVHSDAVTVTELAAGDTWRQQFVPWPKPHPAGNYTVRCSTWIAGDGNPTNDTLTGRFAITARPDWPLGWVELEPLPTSARAAKDGAWLAYDAAGASIVAAKGYKTGDCYHFDITAGSWSELPPWPAGVENKLPYKGSAACADGNGRIYATKGNNTAGFWCYDASANVWNQLADVPLGPSNKKVKGGTDLVFVIEGESAWVYLLKGYKSEFHRYSVAAGTWSSLADAPAGARPKWDKGSWLAYDGEDRIYAHKAKYHELYAYSIRTNTWGSAMPGMPLLCHHTGKSKKSKDGGAAVFLGSLLWALKGGNTQDFYALDPGTMVWSEMETIPAIGSALRKKRVKAGGDITTDGVALYALKGNKTNEFWRYFPGSELRATHVRPLDGRIQSGVLETREPITGSSLQLPADGSAAVLRAGTIRLQLPVGTNQGRIVVRDCAGRVLREWADCPVDRDGSARLDLAGLPSGVAFIHATGLGRPLRVVLLD